MGHSITARRFVPAAGETARRLSLRIRLPALDVFLYLIVTATEPVKRGGPMWVFPDARRSTPLLAVDPREHLLPDRAVGEGFEAGVELRAPAGRELGHLRDR